MNYSHDIQLQLEKHSILVLQVLLDCHFFIKMCKTGLAKSKPCGFLKPPSTFHKHVSTFLRMKWPIVSVAVFAFRFIQPFYSLLLIYIMS